MSCPFCGTTINPGAIVCTGCQAEYRRGGIGAFFRGVVLFVIGTMPVLLVFDKIEKGHKSPSIHIILMSIMCILMLATLIVPFKWALRKSWYRQSTT